MTVLEMVENWGFARVFSPFWRGLGGCWAIHSL